MGMPSCAKSLRIRTTQTVCLATASWRQRAASLSSRPAPSGTYDSGSRASWVKQASQKASVRSVFRRDSATIRMRRAWTT